VGTIKIQTKRYRVSEAAKVDLKQWDTCAKPICDSKENYQEVLNDHVEGLSKLQRAFYADNRYALLLVFQAMDAAGKDGAIQHVMSGVNPQGCQVFSFKHPSAEELAHDFLWRSARVLPERGRIGIFNRSYYEEVLIVRVHKSILAAERVPEATNEDKLWKHRYQSIRNFERHLQRNGTRIIKFFLHVSKDEQRKRFLKRIDDPEKNWKFSPDDLKERAYWKDYMKAYEECLSATSTDDCPWYVVPADSKPDARLIISQVILDTMESLKPQYPTVSLGRRKELQDIRKQLEKA
jgi:PPK2 family polyphosphate:nucleotide phosphotransferase